MLDVDYLNLLRHMEIEELVPVLPPGCRILEFGSGTGQQARYLAEHGFDVVAIDLPTSNYARNRIFPIQEYDGSTIPLPDRSVDVIFSSNVLEHVENLAEISTEFRRILKPGGFAVHVLPTSAWRFWSFATGAAESLKAVVELPRQLLKPRADEGRITVLKREGRRIGSGFIPRGHGTSAEGISELWTFSRSAWRRRFGRCGFKVVEDRSIGLFYTGTMLLGDDLSFERRRLLSRIFGSSTRAYRVEIAERRPD